jgi:hypothetical protein
MGWRTSTYPFQYLRPMSRPQTKRMRQAAATMPTTTPTCLPLDQCAVAAETREGRARRVRRVMCWGETFWRTWVKMLDDTERTEEYKRS